MTDDENVLKGVESLESEGMIRSQKRDSGIAVITKFSNGDSLVQQAGLDSPRDTFSRLPCWLFVCIRGISGLREKC